MISPVILLATLAPPLYVKQEKPVPTASTLKMLLETKCLSSNFPDTAQPEIISGLKLERTEADVGVKFAVDGPVSENDRFVRVWGGATDKGPTSIVLSAIDFKDPSIKDSVVAQVLISNGSDLSVDSIKSALGLNSENQSSVNNGNDYSTNTGSAQFWEGKSGEMALEIQKLVKPSQQITWRVRCQTSTLHRKTY